MKKTTLKFLPFFALPIGSAIFATSCYNQVENDNNADIKTKSYYFKNLSDEYTINDNYINTYTINNSETLYVSIEEMMKYLNGFVDYNVFNKKWNFFSKEPSYTYYWYNNMTKYTMTINWTKNTIKVNNLNYFDNVNYTQNTDYGRQLKYFNYDVQNKPGTNGSVTFDLGKYDFDILNYKKKILIPFPIFNTLFCNINYYSLYFNGDKIFGIDRWLADNMQGIERIKTGSLNNKIASEQYRKDTFNHLCFSLDYFYGLKDHKGIKSFIEYFNENIDIKQKILSSDKNTFSYAYAKLINSNFNELHSTMLSLSFYNDKGDRLRSFLQANPDVASSAKREEFNNISNFLERKRQQRFGVEKTPIVRFKNNMAIISFDSFETGSNEEVTRTNNYDYDTFYLFKYAMKQIIKKPEITKIVVDLSLNGGGNVGAMRKALGYLTDAIINTYQFNSLSKEYTEIGNKVDINLDGKYKFNESYSNYEWYVLTGLNTFSAANQFASIAKDMKIATLIGKKSGGGMCSIMPLVLNDGTTLIISSNNCAINKQKQYIEDGIEPKLNLEYKYFYDDDALLNLINN